MYIYHMIYASLVWTDMTPRMLQLNSKEKLYLQNYNNNSSSFDINI